MDIQRGIAMVFMVFVVLLYLGMVAVGELIEGESYEK